MEECSIIIKETFLGVSEMEECSIIIKIDILGGE